MTRVFLLALCIFTFEFSQAQLPSYLPTNGLVGWWPFNGNANDESGNGNNGTVNGAVLTTDRSGHTNSAYYFDGNGQNISVNGSQNINNLETINQLTVTGWIKNQNDNPNAVFSFFNKYNTQNDLGWEMLLAQNFVDWVLDALWYINPSCNVQLDYNSWVFLSIVYNGNNNLVQIYINNILACERVYSHDMPATNGGPLYFGYSPTGPDEYSKGIIDDIAIYNRALTQAEITALYTGIPPCAATSSTTNLNIPSTQLPYTWNGLTFTAAGTQTAHLKNACGADSAATLNLTVTNTLPSYLPTNGLVGWWPFNGNANDESGNGNNGTTSSVLNSFDRNNNPNSAFLFGSSYNSRVSIGISNPISVSAKTFSCWFKYTINSFGDYPQIYLQGNSYDDMNIDYLMILGQTYNQWGKFGRIGFEYHETSSSYNDARWHHVVYVTNYLSHESKLYVDGQLSVSIITTGVTKLITSFTIGNIPWDEPSDGNRHYVFNGEIDDVAIYQRELSFNEIKALYRGYYCPITDSSSFSASGCNSYTLPWRDSATASGTYTHSYTNATGCDSVVTANITIHHAEVGASMNLSGVGPYTLPWGQTVNSSGYYSHVYQNQYGCDSLVSAYVAVEFPSDSTRNNIGVNVMNPQRNLHIKDVLRLEPRSTAPNNPTKGDLYFDGNINKIRYFNGLQWVDL